MRRLFALTALFTLTLSACSSEKTGAASDALSGHTWAATAISGNPVTGTAGITLAVADGRVSGNSGCNNYGGDVTYGDGKISVGPLMSTKMACMEDGVMLQEQTYLSTLQAARSYAVQPDGSLVITSDAGNLAFRATAGK